MKISAVSFRNYNNLLISRNNNNGEINKRNTVQTSFTSFDSVLTSAVKKAYKSDTDVAKDFGKLIEEVVLKQNIHINPEFTYLKNYYNKNGFRGLLFELWKAKPQEIQLKGIDTNEFENYNLITQNGQPILELTHLGKFGFSSNSPNMTTLTFSNQSATDLIEFGLNSKGNLQVTQTDKYQTITRSFHRSTGALKRVTEQPLHGNLTTTYYNKSGEKSFWKNLFWGGTFVIPQ